MYILDAPAACRLLDAPAARRLFVAAIGACVDDFTVQMNQRAFGGVEVPLTLANTTAQCEDVCRAVRARPRYDVIPCPSVPAS